MRNPYRAVLRTYLRWSLLLLAIVTGMEVLIGGLLLASERPRTIKVVDVFPFEFWLAFLGIRAVQHVREMIDSPRSRVMPGHREAHLLVAGAMTAIIGIVVPCLIAGLTVGFGECGLAVVAVTLAGLTVPATLSQFRYAWFLLGLIFLPFVFASAYFSVDFPFSGSLSSWSIGPTTSWILIVFSLGGLACTGLRLAHFHEEMFEYHRPTLRALILLPFAVRAQIGMRVADLHEEIFEYRRRLKSVPLDRRGPPWFFPSKAMRFERRGGSLPADTLVGRALRFYAAWQTLSVARGFGLAMGAALGALALPKGFAIPDFVGCPTVAYLSICPLVTVLGPSRRYLIEELVRPPSRRDHVRGVGLAMGTAVLVTWLLIQVVGVVMIAIWGRSGTSAAGIWESVAFSLCCLPVLFGAAVWPYRTSLAFTAYIAMFGVMATFFLTPLRLSNSELVCAAASLLFIGILLTRASYLRWMNEEVGPGPPIFGWRDLEGGWFRAPAPRKLRSR